ncbi:MAG: hypothetical protein GXO82_04455 [Chlorobi bacterium]|nr:hypothetical protein [Chlorobiota bacterium]
MSDSTTDLKAIEETTLELYRSICFEEGGQPPVEKMREIFIEDGLLINTNGVEPVGIYVEDFISTYQEQVEEGHITSFHEVELSNKTELFGAIAHRFSTYEASYMVAGKKTTTRGINSLQFIKVEDTWQVTCMVWCDQTDQRKIPPRYLET